MKNWREFERLVATLITEENKENLTVIPNASIYGFISGRKRQIDVLVDFRFDTDLKRRIIFDAKFRKRPVDIKQIESFEGMMKDVGAQRGFIVCSSGHTKSALRRAQKNIGIKIITTEEIENFSLDSFDYCNDENCTDGLVLWDLTPGIIIDDGPAFVQATGKCDSCGKFNIWCWSCGKKMHIDYESELKCLCDEPWFWLTSIEPEADENGQEYKCHYLILVFYSGNYEIIDRRPI